METPPAEGAVIRTSGTPFAASRTCGCCPMGAEVSGRISAAKVSEGCTAKMPSVIQPVIFRARSFFLIFDLLLETVILI